MRLLVSMLFIFIISCNKDDTQITDPDDDLIEQEQGEDNEIEDPEDEQEEDGEELSDENVLVYDEEKALDALVLVEDLSSDEVFLMEKDGTIYHEWNLTNELGNDAYLEDDGKLLALLKTDNDQILFGGSGGQIQLINPDNTIDWQFVYSTEDYNLHHDIERLPNGNIIALVWEKKISEEAQEKGFEGSQDVFIESVIEINPGTNEIVWKWSSWDHLVQDSDSSKLNFMSLEENPQLIDINYNSTSDTSIDGDIMHANSIEYDIHNDLIYISVNYYSEVWVIDHSTTTSQAMTSTGGNYNKGGDLVYRFGNPSTYDSNEERIFFNNHFCNIIKEGLPGEGNIMVFMNGGDLLQSSVFELELPSVLDINEQPTINWFYENADLYFGRVSGALRLSNGNTLIAEGDFGYWEVTEEKEVVWKYNKPGFIWRGYSYSRDSSAIENLN